MKKVKKAICFCALAVLALYLIESLAISMTLRSIVQSSYQNYGLDNPYKNSVSDDIYSNMCFRNGYSSTSNDDPRITENKILLGPISYHWFSGGKAVYCYTYEVYDENGTLASGSWRVPVTIDYVISNGRLLVTGYFEAP